MARLFVQFKLKTTFTIARLYFNALSQQVLHVFNTA
ncbi:Uncharacterised protein [Vibrio cholerae]|nr:Uncharacterised protein [Vibrio cholerae]CSI44376.1 Uncharacterised protein [Vibrio cholerae]